MTTGADEIAEWLRQRVRAAGAAGLVVGLSGGGVNSAVVARLCQRAVPDRALGVLMPCGGDAREGAEARPITEHFALPVVSVNLEPAYTRLAADVRGLLARPTASAAARSAPEDERVPRPLANLKSRLRMATLYYIANESNYLVVGTSNRSELMLGSFTKHGDGGVDLLPIGHLLMGEVRALGRRLKVPEEIIEEAPSAGPSAGRTGGSEMGFSPSHLERYLEEGPDAVPPAIAVRIERMIRLTEHKRALPPIPG